MTDLERFKRWVYPRSDEFGVREYQLAICSTALAHNTLVCLPTGLGKTLIAAVVMYNFYQWFPQGIVIFLAPTKPLVAQQVKACYEIMGISEISTAHLEGTVSVDDRELLWKTKRVFFSTPQTMENDLKRDIIDVSKIVCLVFDEAHRATGSYSYCNILESLFANPRMKECRILALSATPAPEFRKIQNLVRTLRVSMIEIRTEDDPDVTPYCFEKQIEIVKCKAGLEAGLDTLRDMVNDLVRPAVGRVYAARLLSTNQVKYLNRMVIDEAVRAKLNSTSFCQPDPDLEDLAFIGTLIDCRKALGENNHSLAVSILTGKGSDKISADIRTIICRYPQLEYRIHKLIDSLKRAAVDKQFLEKRQPKLLHLRNIVIEHFERHNRQSSSSRVIIFAELRATVYDIVEDLKSLNSQTVSILPVAFVGQATSTPTDSYGDQARPGSSKGLKQKEQQEVLDKFRNGSINVLVATSIAEEGLDIAEVDLIVLFDTVASPARMVQRMGRTGRKRSGKVIMLVVEGKDEAKVEKASESLQYVQRLLRDPMQTAKLRLCSDESPRMIPNGLPFPEVDFKNMNVREFDGRLIQGSKWHSDKKSDSFVSLSRIDKYFTDPINVANCEKPSPLKISSKESTNNIIIVSDGDEELFCKENEAVNVLNLSSNTTNLPERVAPIDQNRTSEIISEASSIAISSMKTFKDLLWADAHTRRNRKAIRIERMDHFYSDKYASLVEKLKERSQAILHNRTLEQSIFNPEIHPNSRPPHLSANSEERELKANCEQKYIVVNTKQEINGFETSSFSKEIVSANPLGHLVQSHNKIESQISSSPKMVNKINAPDFVFESHILPSPMMNFPNFAVPCKSGQSDDSFSREPLRTKPDITSNIKAGRRIQSKFILVDSSDDEDENCDVLSSQLPLSDNSLKPDFQFERLQANAIPLDISTMSTCVDPALTLTSIAKSPTPSSPPKAATSSHRKVKTNKLPINSNHEFGSKSRKPINSIKSLKVAELSLDKSACLDNKTGSVSTPDPSLQPAHYSPTTNRTEECEWKEELRLSGPDDKRKCCVCFQGDLDDDEPLLECKGECGMNVHKFCFGLTNDIELFICDGCDYNIKRPDYAIHASRCCLCNKSEGLMRREEVSRKKNCSMAHIACVLFCPELTVSSDMRPNNLSSIDRERSNLFCSVCRGRGGAAVQCNSKKCLEACHPYCAMTKGDWSLVIQHEISGSIEEGTVTTYEMYCPLHLSFVPLPLNESAQFIWRANEQNQIISNEADDVTTKRKDRSVKFLGNGSEFSSPNLPERQLSRLTKNGKRTDNESKKRKIREIEKHRLRTHVQRYFDEEAELSGSDEDESEDEDDEDSALSGEFINDSELTQGSEAIYLSVDRRHMEEHSPFFSSQTPQLKFRGAEKGLPIIESILRRHRRRQEADKESDDSIDCENSDVTPEEKHLQSIEGPKRTFKQFVMMSSSSDSSDLEVDRVSKLVSSKTSPIAPNPRASNLKDSKYFQENASRASPAIMSMLEDDEW